MENVTHTPGDKYSEETISTDRVTLYIGAKSPTLQVDGEDVYQYECTSGGLLGFGPLGDDDIYADDGELLPQWAFIAPVLAEADRILSLSK